MYESKKRWRSFISKGEAMRVAFSCDLEPTSGKQKFAMRLADAFKNKGIRVTDKKPHINLVFLDGIRKNCKNIFRLDGVLMNTQVSYKKKNAKLKETIRQCDGIIYQNEFCKQSADVYLGKFPSYAIILNGAILPTAEKYYHKKPYISTISRWRPHKRLKDTVDSFLSSDLKKTHDLLVIGDPDYVVSDASVCYKGQLGPDDCWKVLNGSVYVVHLAYLDWCPNSVVESLIAGKNVMHSSAGGTKYVVRDNGIMIPDKEWNFQPIDLTNPPRLDFNLVNKAYIDMLDLKCPVVDYLSIDNIADQYINYMRKILDGGSY